MLYRLKFSLEYSDNINAMKTREIKKRFEEIAKGYNNDTLLGYISFFMENLTSAENRDYNVRLNSLRLKVYNRVARLRGLK